jgi:malonyl-CoA O-methyltransferase
MNERARIIAESFGAASETYDSAARVQAIAAERLAGRLAEALSKPPRNILEFGCGTGLFTAHLRRLWPDARIVVSDLAPQMARFCRQRHGEVALVMDAERPCFAEQSFDLVCGSLAAQWFVRPEQSIRGLQRLAAPGGIVALATLGPATLGEWARARVAAGLSPGGLDYLTLEELAAIGVPGAEIKLAAREIVRDPVPNAHAFLAGLRAIGADVDGKNPSGPPAGLRRAMRALDHAASAVTYELLTLIWQQVTVRNAGMQAETD